MTGTIVSRVSASPHVEILVVRIDGDQNPTVAEGDAFELTPRAKDDEVQP